MPLSRWAKVAMDGSQIISIVTVALVVARAVNILSSNRPGLKYRPRGPPWTAEIGGAGCGAAELRVELGAGRVAQIQAVTGPALSVAWRSGLASCYRA